MVTRQKKMPSVQKMPTVLNDCSSRESDDTSTPPFLVATPCPLRWIVVALYVPTQPTIQPFQHAPTSQTERSRESMRDCEPVLKLYHLSSRPTVSRYPQQAMCTGLRPVTDTIRCQPPPPPPQLSCIRSLNSGNELRTSNGRTDARTDEQTHERRTTNDERRTTNDERRTTNDERRTTNDERRTTNDEEFRTSTGFHNCLLFTIISTFNDVLLFSKMTY